MVFSMKLQHEYFLHIKNRTKTIEMRLNDEKRRQIKPGDIIEFFDLKTQETIQAVVKNLYPYDNFNELYQHHDKISIGYSKDEIADYKDMEKIYSFEDILKYGVLAIEINVINT